MSPFGHATKEEKKKGVEGGCSVSIEWQYGRDGLPHYRMGMMAAVGLTDGHPNG